MFDEALPMHFPADRLRQKAIGRELGRLYEQVLAEPVPEDFLLPFNDLKQVRGASLGNNAS